LIEPKPQDHAKATLAPILTRDDGRMDFAAHTATQLRNRWRGFQPWPGAFTSLDGKKLIVHRMAVLEGADLRVGMACEAGRAFTEGARLMVACAANTWLELLELQLEGKKRMSAADFLRGLPISAGARLG
jgi:methionyl-tRNA formyltransferase